MQNEVLQIFVPSRMPTAADIVNNSIGADYQRM
ncbi:MAG: VanZ family protein [Scytonematopsis contorta HA4267-MV1]|nr:VanZ family protein [Scytonematopsis contorta HA4267-MV1]